MGGWMGVSLCVCVCKICEMNDITIIEHKRSQCSNMISHIPFCFRISHIDARQCVRWVFLFLHTIHPRFLYVTINQIEYFSLWFFVLVQAADAAAAAQIKFVTRCAGEWKLSLRARERAGPVVIYAKLKYCILPAHSAPTLHLNMSYSWNNVCPPTENLCKRDHTAPAM